MAGAVPGTGQRIPLPAFREPANRFPEAIDGTRRPRGGFPDAIDGPPGSIGRMRRANDGFRKASLSTSRSPSPGETAARSARAGPPAASGNPRVAFAEPRALSAASVACTCRCRRRP